MTPSAPEARRASIGPVEVVERVEQVARQRADRVDPVGVGLLLGPLLIVGELGPGSQGLIAILVALLLELGDVDSDSRLTDRRSPPATCPRPRRVVRLRRGSAFSIDHRIGCRMLRRSWRLRVVSFMLHGSWLARIHRG